MSLCFFHTIILLWTPAGTRVPHWEIVLLLLGAILWPIWLIALVVSLILGGPLLSLFRFCRKLNSKVNN